MKLTDYVVEFLANEGIRHIFGLTGGAVVHLFDSVNKNERVQPIFCHHEQAAAFSAQAYSRVSNNLGAAIVTTGPGGTNTVTGVCAAWLDSVPCIYISGQTRLAHTTKGKLIRQCGTQQLDIISIVSPITKYAVMIEDPKSIKYHLQKAAHIARSGRPGPVWLDIPMDFQWMSINPEELEDYVIPEPKLYKSYDNMQGSVSNCIKLMKNAKRPIILAGYGLRLAHAEIEFKKLYTQLKYPVLTSWNASDLLSTDEELYLGRPGIFGQRGANLAIQNCDFLLCIGSHLPIPITGTVFNAFAREAKKVIVDIDPSELEHRNIPVDLTIECDAKMFIYEILKQIGDLSLPDIQKWHDKCRHYKNKYNAVQCNDENSKLNKVNPYVFMDVLSESLSSDDVVVVDGGGSVNQVAFQAMKFKEGQRIVISAGLCAMGSGLPDSIGAFFGSRGKRIICLCGDGGIQLNIQELQTISHHNMDIKIFIMNNYGYLSIRNTQNSFLNHKHIGSSCEGGLSLPDITKIANAYGVRTLRIRHQAELYEKVVWALSQKGPLLCDVELRADQEIGPCQGFYETNIDGSFSARPLEDMYPYLDRKDFDDCMLIKPWSNR